MDKPLLDGVGKKIYIDKDKVIISKSIGKNLELSIRDIMDISYEKGTMSKNGFIHIKWKKAQGKISNEDIMFRCFSNDAAGEFVSSVSNYLNNTCENFTVERIEKNDFFEQLSKGAKEKVNSQIQEQGRLKELKKEEIPYCPKCHSTSVTLTDKKLSIGKALVGGILAGEVGAVLGGLSSKKVILVCMNCGHKWKPGKK